MMQRVNEILKDMKAKAAAEAVLLTSSDGLVLGSVQDDGLELESLAAYAASNMMTSERMGESMNCGIPDSVMIIYGGRAVVMAPVGPVVAILMGSNAVQLGNLRLQLKRAMVDLSAALQDEMDFKTSKPQPQVTSPKAPILEEAPAPEIAAPKSTAVDPALNGGSARRGVPVVRRGSSVNLK